MRLICRVTQQGLRPLYGSDYDEHKRLKEGDEVVVEIKRARNVKFHKKYFALLRLALDSMPEQIVAQYRLYSVEDLNKLVKYFLGYADLVSVGELHYLQERSIAFDKMDESEFETFYKRAVQLIRDTFLIGVTDEQIKEELYRFL
jgi:hypothetical protein